MTTWLKFDQEKILEGTVLAIILLLIDRLLYLTTDSGLPWKLIVFGLWLWILIRFKWDGRASLEVGWGLLILGLIFRALKPDPFLLEQTALTAFYFFSLGTLQLIGKMVLAKKS